MTQRAVSLPGDEIFDREQDIRASVANDPLLQESIDVTTELFAEAVHERVLRLSMAHPEIALHEKRVADELARERARREARQRLATEERGTRAPLDIATLRERLARPGSAAPWRIAGWQPADSRVLLAAQFKSGKTTLIGGLIRSVIDGDPWLDRDRVEPIAGAVALIDTEMSHRQLDDWLRAQAIRRDDQVIVVPLRGAVAAFDLLDPLVRSEWAMRLKAMDVSYLVWDCVRPVLDALGLDEHRDAGRLLVAFDALLAEAGIPEACVVHHMGHTAERSRGDSRLRDWPDVEWRLVRQDDDPASARFLAAYGRDVDQAEQQLAYDAASRRLSISGGSRRDVATHDALGAVLELLEGAPAPMSVRAIQAALAESEHPRDAVRAAIQRGVRDGLILTEPGPRRAILHRSVCERAAVRGECAAHAKRECASAYIEAHTRTHIPPTPELPLNRTLNGSTPFHFDPREAFGPHEPKGTGQAS